MKRFVDEGITKAAAMAGGQSHQSRRAFLSEALSSMHISKEAKLVTANDFNIEYASESVAWLVNTTPQEAEKDNLLQWVAPKYRELFEEMVKDPNTCLSKPVEVRDVLLEVNGTSHFFDIHVQRPNTNSNDGMLLVALQQVDERQHLEEQLDKTRYELDYLIYKASHDLRSPLRTMLGLINLSEIDPNWDSGECMGLIRSTIMELDKFIDDMANISLNQQLAVRTEKIEFKSMINEIVGYLEKYMDASAKVQLRLDIEENMPLYSDPIRLNLILSNLLSNAYQFYDTDKAYNYVQVSISTEGNNYHLSISDNGMGIAEKHQPFIYDMFFRASDYSKGCGLGLYMVKDALKKLDGNISVHSIPGEGTTFTLDIPNRLCNLQ